MTSLKNLPSDLLFDYAYSKMVSSAIPSFLHEINNPLTALASSAKMLTDESLEPDFRRELSAAVSPCVDKLIEISDAARNIVKARREGSLTNAGRLLKDFALLMNAHWNRENVVVKNEIPESHPALNISPAGFLLACFTIITIYRKLSISSSESSPKMKSISAAGGFEKTTFTLVFSTTKPDASAHEKSTKTNWFPEKLAPISFDPEKDIALLTATTAVETMLLECDAKFRWQREAGLIVCKIKLPLCGENDATSGWIG